MRKRWLLLLVVSAAASWAVAKERTERGRELQGEVLSAVTAKGRLEPLAGMSAVGNITVKPLSQRKLGADVDSPDFHRYANRCGACHRPPDPALHTLAAWPAVIERMHANMRSAGTLGLQPEQRDAVLRFLAKHASH